MKVYDSIFFLILVYAHQHTNTHTHMYTHTLVVKQFQSYVDPEDATAHVAGEGENVALPLGESTLTCNLGVPIIVVCCKVRFACVNHDRNTVSLFLQSDSVSELEKTHGYRDDHLDFIQQSVRKFCLHCIPLSNLSLIMF